MASLPPWPRPKFPTDEVTQALSDPNLDFTEFSTWKDLFELAEEFTGKRLYVTQSSNGTPIARYEVALVANTEDDECPVVLFSAGGLSGDGGNLGGSLILKFTPPHQRTLIERFEFGEPRIG
jgi:hypothetical protein